MTAPPLVLASPVTTTSQSSFDALVNESWLDPSSKPVFQYNKMRTELRKIRPSVLISKGEDGYEVYVSLPVCLLDGTASREYAAEAS